VASKSLQKVMKDPAKTEAASRSHFKYREFTYTDGKEDHPANEVYSHPVSLHQTITCRFKHCALLHTPHFSLVKLSLPPLYTYTVP